MDRFYLENTSGGFSKFWRGCRVNNLFIGWWGAIGTVGQKKVWVYDTARSAEVAFHKKEDDKRDKGYEPAKDELTDEELLDIVDGILRKQLYELTWQAWSLSNEHLEMAAEQADELLSDIGRPQGCKLNTVISGNRTRVIIATAHDTMEFGYPPPDVIEQIQRATGFPSRDGYLSSDGDGRGTIITEGKILDLPVRLFFTRLYALTQDHSMVLFLRPPDREGSIRVIDSFGEELGAIPALPRKRPRWREVRDDLIAAMQHRRMLPGAMTVPQSGVNINGNIIDVITDW